MQIRPFAIERFYERWEFRAELMLSSSDCESRTVGELLELEPDARERLLAMRLGYTEVPGSEELRAAVAGGYERAAAEDVLTLAAAEEGIFLVYHALVEPGDHVVVEAPCYGSAIELARSTGARGEPLAAAPRGRLGTRPRGARTAARDDTRLIYINSPHNPTGMQMPTGDLRARGGARRASAPRCCSATRSTAASSTTPPPGCRRRATPTSGRISLGTVSKAHGLPGLRIGWLACREPELLDAR